MSSPAPDADDPSVAWDPRLARSLEEQVPPLLRRWNEAGGLAAADVHVAHRLGVLGGEEDPEVLLACALTVRAVREGSVCLDLADVAAMVPTTDERLAVPAPGAVTGAGSAGPEPLPEPPPVPEAGPWAAKVRASVLVGPDRPWTWSSDRLYLQRYLGEEQQVAEDLLRREQLGVAVDEQRLAEALDEAYGPGVVGDVSDPSTAYADQRAAVETACRHRTSVVTGGPGAGKTTTLARLIVVLLRLREPGDPPLRIHLAAPTGKAAARMAQSVRASVEAEGFPAPDLADQLLALPATTVHRLLGYRPGHGTRFAHDAQHRLPADLVVVDEASMLSLTLTARLLEAMRPDARLVLVGDADQLASVDAGAVLGDLVAGLATRAQAPVARLGESRRFGSRIGRLADAVRNGDVDDVLDQLRETQDDPASPVRWVAADGAPGQPGGRRLAELALEHAGRLHDAALHAADDVAAMAELGRFRLLCAHREGPYGAGTWNRQTTRQLGESLGHHLPLWYAGRPLLVTTNDPGLGLFNGDSAVVVAGRDGLQARIDDGSAAGRGLGTSRLTETATAYAMTVHRAQGSQFDHVAVLLPDPTSRVLTRELLYTALTRASSRVTLVGTEAALRAAVDRQARRATRLASRLAERPDQQPG